MHPELPVDAELDPASGFRNLDVIVVVAVVATPPALLLSWPSPGGALCALALVGATIALLTAALASRSVGALTRGVVCAAGTLFVSVLLGFALNAFPRGLSRPNLLLSLLLIALVAYVVARRRGAGQPLRAPRTALLRAGTWSDRAQIAAAAVLVVIGVAVTTSTMHVRDTATFAELALISTSPVAGVVEVRNQLEVRQSFVVDVTGGPAPRQFRFSLDPGQAWTESVETGANTRAQLYLGTEPGQPYRTVWLASR